MRLQRRERLKVGKCDPEHLLEVIGFHSELLGFDCFVDWIEGRGNLKESECLGLDCRWIEMLDTDGLHKAEGIDAIVEVDLESVKMSDYLVRMRGRRNVR